MVDAVIRSYPNRISQAIVPITYLDYLSQSFLPKYYSYPCSNYLNIQVSFDTMNLRVFVPKIYLDRTELPILNEFPLGIFFATLYVVALPKLWQQVVFGVQSTVTDSVSWSATEYSNQNVVSDPLLWSAGINIKNTLLGSLAWPASEWWSTSISSHTATTISTCEDEFSKDVVESLAQADDILAGILAGTS